MQLRRRSVWVAIFITGLMVAGIALRVGAEEIRGDATTVYQLTEIVVGIVSYFLPIVFGVLLADRLPRDARLNASELLDSLPAPASTRLWGKYLGASTATMIPLFAAYVFVVATIAVKLQRLDMLPALLPIFAVTVVPGLLFVGAFSIACTTVLPTPFYAIFFIGYWFWGNVLPPSRLPTISCTPLTPIGHYIATGIFDALPNACGFTQAKIGVGGALESIALLLLIGAAAILATSTFRNWRSQQL
jgi:ABC-type transport system involved in multi-copper enzyme maturation permease subunit